MAPNGAGVHSENLKKLDELVFSKISPPAESFANRHRLLIRKYYHDGPSWDLTFRRKRGGIGLIEIVLTNPGVSVFVPETMKKLLDVSITVEFMVCATCWIDDYDTEMGRLRREEMGTFRYGVDKDAHLERLLESALKRILGWEVADLTEHSGPNQWKNTWKTKEEFEKAAATAYINGKMVPLPLL